MTEPPVAISVVIPSYNRSALLRRCLDSLAKQTAEPGSFEVVVVDDGSTDGTAEMLEEIRTPYRLRTIRLQQSRWARARNAGVEAAAGAVCLHVDDDVICAPKLVAEHLTAFREDERTVGIGHLIQEPPAARDWYARSVAKGIEEHYEDMLHRDARWTDCYGANFSSPRAAFLEVGGFDTELQAAVDLELGLRLEQAGCVLRYLPAAVGVHDDQKLVGQMLRDERRNGEAHVMMVDRYPVTLPLMLDWRAGGAGWVELALRRALIVLRAPSAPLAWLGRLLPGAGRKMVWLHFVRRYTFWRSVRRHVSRSRWKSLTESKELEPTPAAAVGAEGSP